MFWQFKRVIQLIPAFNFTTDESYSASENKAYSVRTWKAFYE
jgi:hypothetical protein